MRAKRATARLLGDCALSGGELNGSALLEEIMQLQALRSTFCHAIAVCALAGLAAACGTSPVSPSAAPGSGFAAEAATATLSAAAGHETPFKGRLDGAYTLAFPSPLTLLVEGTGTGNATQLGQFTFDYDESVNLSTGVGTGTYEFTAASGDKLTASWTGAGFPTADPTVLRIVENATINGGTGRFANASGSFRVERLFSFVTNAGGGSFDGTIRLR
jgi:hypothetical protein